MDKIKSWDKISKLGLYFRKKLKLIAKKNNLDIEIKGLLAIPVFSIKNDSKNIYKTFITQEMLKSGFIINNSVYISICHNKKIFNKFFKVLDKIFKLIKKYKTINDLKKQLEASSSKSGFGRLN